MMNPEATIQNTRGAIWRRIVEPECGDLPVEAAAYLLKLDFRESDHRRMEELNQKANEGRLDASERAELEEYLRASDLIMLLQSKARRSLN
jgi:hypothetical protein